MKTLPFELCDLSRQKPTKTFFSELQLHDKYLRYKVKFNADEIDEETGITQTDVGKYWDIIALKAQVVAFDLYFTSDEKWKITISVNGFSEDIKIYFLDFVKAKAFHEELFKWIIS